MAKVKVRIAVAVDATGQWCAYGHHRGVSWDMVLDSVDDGEARYWVEAELDVPEAQTVAATVTPA